MERLLTRLERRFGRFALPGWTWYLVGLQGLVFVLGLTNPDIVQLLVLDRSAVLHGQVWRLVTYLFIPPSFHPIWVLFDLYWLYLIGVSLEAEWGPFRYEVYWILGMIATTAIAFGFNVPATNEQLLLSLFLAFATLFPDYVIYIFFVLPVKVKWLGLVAGAYLLAEIGMSHGLAKLLPVVAIGNYLLFFTPTLVQRVRSGAFLAGRASARGAFRRSEREAPKARRRCTLCGVDDSDPNVEFRVCTCEKCGGKPTEFCLTHARNH